MTLISLEFMKVTRPGSTVCVIQTPSQHRPGAAPRFPRRFYAPLSSFPLFSPGFVFNVRQPPPSPRKRVLCRNPSNRPQERNGVVLQLAGSTCRHACEEQNRERLRLFLLHPQSPPDGGRAGDGGRMSPPRPVRPWEAAEGSGGKQSAAAVNGVCAESLLGSLRVCAHGGI